MTHRIVNLRDMEITVEVTSPDIDVAIFYKRPAKEQAIADLLPIMKNLNLDYCEIKEYDLYNKYKVSYTLNSEGVVYHATLNDLPNSHYEDDPELHKILAYLEAPSLAPCDVTG